MSVVAGVAILASTALPPAALAKNSAAQNAALNQMALQMYLQQQANTQNQALAQQQSYYNGQAVWNNRLNTPWTGVNYANPYANNAYNGYVNSTSCPARNTAFQYGGNNNWRGHHRHHEWQQEHQGWQQALQQGFNSYRRY